MGRLVACIYISVGYVYEIGEGKCRGYASVVRGAAGVEAVVVRVQAYACCLDGEAGAACPARSCSHAAAPNTAAAGTVGVAGKSCAGSVEPWMQLSFRRKRRNNKHDNDTRGSKRQSSPASLHTDTSIEAPSLSQSTLRHSAQAHSHAVVSLKSASMSC